MTARRGASPPSAAIRAIFFDVDFTLIHPGPTFQGHGYAEACARHGVDADASRFDAAVAAASSTLHAEGGPYDPEVFIDYTRRIIEGMGGGGAGADAAARDLYVAWSACHHFTLYEEVPEVLRALHADGFTIGLISNTQRSLKTFEEHFALDGLFTVAISSSDHGYMKPHPSIFKEGLRQAGVAAHEAVMVGDSVPHDIAGALRLGMRGILVARSGLSRGAPPEVPVIQSLRELRGLL
jgi:HAD superfamily hydrolase (TIGR01662 family)